MRKFSSAIINLFIPPYNVFACEHYSGEYVWGTLLANGTEMKVKIDSIMREATLIEMGQAFDKRYKTGRNRICGKNQSITDNM
jgi:hypothetical protein